MVKGKVRNSILPYTAALNSTLNTTPNVQPRTDDQTKATMIIEVWPQGVTGAFKCIKGWFQKRIVFVEVNGEFDLKLLYFCEGRWVGMSCCFYQ